LIFAIGLLTATSPAQTVSQNTGELTEIKERRDKNETSDENETSGEIDKDKTHDGKTAGKTKQYPPPKPPRFGGHVGIVIPIVTRGNGMTTTIAENLVVVQVREVQYTPVYGYKTNHLSSLQQFRDYSARADC
jgi:hypothetical protein